MGVLHMESGPVYTGADATARINQALREHRSPLVPPADPKHQLARAVRIIMERGEDWPVARLTVRHGDWFDDDRGGGE